MVTPVLKLPNINEQFILQTKRQIQVKEQFFNTRMVSRNQLLMPIRNLHHHKLSVPQLKKSILLLFGLFRNFRDICSAKNSFLRQIISHCFFFFYLSLSCRMQVNEMDTAFTAVQNRIMAIKGAENVGAECLSSL